MTLIGKKYYPKDNSYAICLSTGSNNALLAACLATNYVEAETIIKSEPFEVMVQYLTVGKNIKMILVEDSMGFIYCVLYEENGLKRISKERIVTLKSEMNGIL